MRKTFLWQLTVGQSFVGAEFEDLSKDRRHRDPLRMAPGLWCSVGLVIVPWLGAALLYMAFVVL